MKQVYFIKPIGMAGPVKIGGSCHPDKRVGSLADWSPFPLEVIATIEGDYVTERRFHALFEAFHYHREWFHGHADIFAAVAQINAGAFDAATLPAPLCIWKRPRLPTPITDRAQGEAA